MTERKTAKQEPTEYVVLQLVRVQGATNFTEVFEIPPKSKAQRLYASMQKGVWVPIGSTKGTGSERKIIDAVVGNEPGTFKAVAARSWAGGETKAQETIMASRPFEEG